MSKTVTATIGNMDLIFEHFPVKVIANRSCPEIKLAGVNVGPFDEGNEYEIQYWIAQRLVKFGIARFHEEETLDASKIFKSQWKERVQTVGQISKLEDNFYPKLRRYLAELKKEIVKQPEKMREHEKVKQLAWDITNSRLKKIVSLASAPAQTENVLKNFTSEEKFLYTQLYTLINKWKTQILEYEGEEE